MTKAEKEILADLVDKMDDMQGEITEIKTTLASWTGGRKALVWGIGVLLSLGVIVSTIYAAIRASRV